MLRYLSDLCPIMYDITDVENGIWKDLIVHGNDHLSDNFLTSRLFFLAEQTRLDQQKSFPISVFREIAGNRAKTTKVFSRKRREKEKFSLSKTNICLR